MYVCMYVRTYVCMYVGIHVDIQDSLWSIHYIYLHTSTYIQTNIHAYIHTYVRYRLGPKDIVASHLEMKPIFESLTAEITNKFRASKPSRYVAVIDLFDEVGR